MVTSAHLSTQNVGVAPPQDAPQDPSVHTMPDVQASSHAPQWKRFVSVSTQASPHRVGVEPPQDAPQDPSLHSSPEPQAASQAPQ